MNEECHWEKIINEILPAHPTCTLIAQELLQLLYRILYLQIPSIADFWSVDSATYDPRSFRARNGRGAFHWASQTASA
jgi:hypothetical protein